MRSCVVTVAVVAVAIVAVTVAAIAIAVAVDAAAAVEAVGFSLPRVGRRVCLSGSDRNVGYPERDGEGRSVRRCTPPIFSFAFSAPRSKNFPKLAIHDLVSRSLPPSTPLRLSDRSSHSARAMFIVLVSG